MMMMPKRKPRCQIDYQLLSKEPNFFVIPPKLCEPHPFDETQTIYRSGEEVRCYRYRDRSSNRITTISITKSDWFSYPPFRDCPDSIPHDESWMILFSVYIPSQSSSFLPVARYKVVKSDYRNQIEIEQIGKTKKERLPILKEMWDTEAISVIPRMMDPNMLEINAPRRELIKQRRRRSPNKNCESSS